MKDGIFREVGERVAIDDFTKALTVPMAKAEHHHSKFGFALSLDGAFAPPITAYATGRVAGGASEADIFQEIRRTSRELAAFVEGTRLQHEACVGKPWLAHKVGVLSGPAVIDMDGCMLRAASDGSDAWEFTIRIFYGLFEWREAEREGIPLPSHDRPPAAAR